VLKNQGYEYGRNDGHGKQHLASTLGMMTMLAFLVDQIQEQACRVYREARTARRTKKNLWEQMRVYMNTFRVPDWSTMMALLIDPDAVGVSIDPRPG